jgi:hypothetical protein
MSVIDVVLSEESHKKLRDEYESTSATWSRLGKQSLPPTFQQWVGLRAAEQVSGAMSHADLDDMRVFQAIERLISSLRQQGFDLAHIARNGDAPEQSSLNLAQMMVNDFKLQPQYQKRLQDLFEHYVKGAKEIADMAQVGLTNRAYGALSEAYRALSDRTAQSVDRLGTERAIGRVEGAAAILVSLDVMERNVAEKKTDTFKREMRGKPKPGWVGKVFGGLADKE